ncbi:hypothetical protein [Lactobacillus corticis]|uniref:Uncharacterized protein n=1 Tax=Lactobacillus corticis TaxID=2201249 RepID=A0A916QHX0_9LACO|nr:hypothetical protein [Lactobacillus corticis]GFZ26573.1 hypothetical protein LCB40_04530 [Lactobacillus corticis]
MVSVQKLLFIIPCLYEQQTIVPTLLHFLKIIDETKINADIFVVTTNKEKVKNEKSKTTYEVVQEFISEGEKYKAVHLLNYPGEDGMMADQLNFVKEEIFKNYSLTATKTYFCVYNADSRPGKQAILELQRITSKAEYPLVIQEYSALFSNLQSLSPIMKGFAVYQTNFEITNGLTNSVLYSKFLRNHVVGHGLCLRFDYLQKIGGFTTDYWCEDIYLSFYLRDKDVSIYPMLALEYGETPKKLLILMKQNANWFKTLSEAKKIYHSFHHGNLYNARLYYLNQIRGAIAWLTLPIIYRKLQ